MEIKWSDRRTILVLYLSAKSLNLKCSWDWRLIQCFLCTAQCIAGGAGSPHSLRHNNDGVCAQSALPSVSLTFVTNMNTKGVNVAIIFTILREEGLFNCLHKNSILSNRFISRKHYWATSFSIVSCSSCCHLSFIL